MYIHLLKSTPGFAAYLSLNLWSLVTRSSLIPWPFINWIEKKKNFITHYSLASSIFKVVIIALPSFLDAFIKALMLYTPCKATWSSLPEGNLQIFSFLHVLIFTSLFTKISLHIFICTNWSSHLYLHKLVFTSLFTQTGLYILLQTWSSHLLTGLYFLFKSDTFLKCKLNYNCLSQQD